MAPGSKKWWDDDEDDLPDWGPYIGYTPVKKTNEDFWKEYNKPKHLTDYVPGTRLLKSDWTGTKFWEHKPRYVYTFKFKFPTSEGRCPICGGFLLHKRSKYGEFFGCNNFPKCNYKCTVKQYHAIIPEIDIETKWKMIAEQQKQNIINQETESQNTMKASEAKALTAKNEKWKYIRKSIDKEIKNNAERGESSMKIFLYEEHDHNKVIESLKNDGFKANCMCNFDPRENDTMYVYKVSW